MIAVFSETAAKAHIDTVDAQIARQKTLARGCNIPAYVGFSLPLTDISIRARGLEVLPVSQFETQMMDELRMLFDDYFKARRAHRIAVLSGTMDDIRKCASVELAAMKALKVWGADEAAVRTLASHIINQESEK